MRVLAIVLSLIGPLLTVVLAGVAAIAAVIISFDVFNQTLFVVLTTLGSLPGVAVSGFATALGLRATTKRHQRRWMLALAGWTGAVVVVTCVLWLFFNSSQLPWVYVIATLPLVNLLYWVLPSGREG